MIKYFINKLLIRRYISAYVRQIVEEGTEGEGPHSIDGRVKVGSDERQEAQDVLCSRRYFIVLRHSHVLPRRVRAGSRYN